VNIKATTAAEGPFFAGSDRAVKFRHGAEGSELPKDRFEIPLSLNHARPILSLTLFSSSPMSPHRTRHGSSVVSSQTSTPPKRSHRSTKKVRKSTNTFFAALEKATKNNDLKYVFFFDLHAFSDCFLPFKYHQESETLPSGWTMGLSLN
jgi:hypothetical protein